MGPPILLEVGTAYCCRLKIEILLSNTNCLLAALLNYSTTLKMEVIRSSERSGITQRTTRRHIPEEDTLQY
jgi:hypothetical protein